MGIQTLWILWQNSSIYPSSFNSSVSKTWDWYAEGLRFKSEHGLCYLFHYTAFFMKIRFNSGMSSQEKLKYIVSKYWMKIHKNMKFGPIHTCEHVFSTNIFFFSLTQELLVQQPIKLYQYSIISCFVISNYGLL